MLRPALATINPVTGVRTTLICRSSGRRSLIMKGTGLCCGIGGILKMTDADVSAAIGRRCVEGFADCRHIITGCSGCTLQLASAAPSGVTVRHWLDVVDISV